MSEWTADTALGVLLKDLKAAHAEGLKYNVALPFNALASVLLFDSMGEQPKPSASLLRIAERIECRSSAAQAHQEPK